MATPDASLLATLTAAFIAEDGQGSEPRATADLADAAWPAMQQRRPTVADAESCRLAMLSCAMANQHPASRVWRARSQARAAATGWREGLAILIISDAFSLLAQANDDYPVGRTLDVLRPAPEARAIIEAALTALPEGDDETPPPGPTAPTRRSVRRMVAEKTGFLLLLEADLDAARDSYTRASEWAEGRARDEVKVALGLALVEHLAGTDPSAPVRTAWLAGRAAELGIVDLSTAAEHNARMMTTGRTALRAYEIL